MSDYNINNAKNDIQNLQDQNNYDFQEIKRLDGLLKDYDKRVTQAINFNNLINKKIESDYENIKKIILDENASATLNNKIEVNKILMQNQINENKTFTKNNIDAINLQLDTINLEKANESFVTRKIAEAKLEGAGVDTSSLAFRSDVDDELLKGEKRLDLKYIRGTIYGNGDFSDDTKYFRTENPLLYKTDTSSKIYVKDGYQIIVWRWANLSENALAAQTFTTTTDFTFKANLFYHFVLKRIDTTQTMLDGEISNIKIITYPNYYFKVGLNEANNKINELDTTVNNLLENFGATYATNYTVKEDEIINNVYKSLTSGTIVFGLITDNHCGIKSWESCYKHGKILNSLAQRVGADFCINLGDIFVDVDDINENLYRLNEYWKYNNNSFLPNLYCKGNHECFVQTDNKVALEDWQILAQTQRTNRYVSKSTNELYYYFDIRQCRFIVLDSSSNTNCGFSDKQEQFLQEAFNSIGDKKAVIFTHIPLDSSLMLQATPKNADKIRNILSKNKVAIIQPLYYILNFYFLIFLLTFLKPVLKYIL